MSGFSLIEILVSLLLLSIVLFGLDAIEMRAVAQLKSICFLQIASNQLDALAEKLHTENATTNLDAWMVQWNAENQMVLPHGHGVLTGSFPEYSATIYWGKSQDQCRQNQIGVSGCLKVIVRLA